MIVSIYIMGSAVLMPEFYGISIKRAPPTTDKTDFNEKSLEERIMIYRSIYEDLSESSLFSNCKESKIIEVV